MKRFLTLSLLLFVGSLFAQPPNDRRDERKDRIKAHKIAFISTELDLSSEEAEKFWPVYNEMEAEMEKIHEERRKYHKKMRDFDDLSEEEAYNATEKIFELEAQETALRKKYLGKFAAVVGKKKAAKVFMAEEKFKRELLKKLKDQHGPPNDGPPHH